MMDNFTVEGLRASLHEKGVPEHIHEGLVEWVRHGRPVGSFLQAVLENDFKDAVTGADITNRRRLYEIAIWVVNCCPGMCQGSRETVKEWNACGGLEGLAQASADELEGNG